MLRQKIKIRIMYVRKSRSDAQFESVEQAQTLIKYK